MTTRHVFLPADAARLKEAAEEVGCFLSYIERLFRLLRTLGSEPGIVDRGAKEMPSYLWALSELATLALAQLNEKHGYELDRLSQRLNWAMEPPGGAAGALGGKEGGDGA